MKPAIPALFACLLVAACTASPATQEPLDLPVSTTAPAATITPTVTSTHTPQPSATPTLIPLSQLDLTGIIYQPGDLPADFVLIDMRRIGTARMESVPPADLVTEVNFNIPGTDDTINVLVFVYESLQAAGDAYLQVGMGAAATSDFGEQAFVFNQAFLEDEAAYASEAGFLRCHAIALLTMFTLDWADATLLPAYAQKLDARLADVACR